MFPSRLGAALRRRASQDEAFSLVEVMIALFILSVGIFALASTAITSIQSTRISRERQDAMQLASTLIESARAEGFDTVALNTAEYDPVSDGATYNGETVHVRHDGGVPHEVVAAPHTARVWVTWTSADEDEKRVTVQVGWNDRGAREVVQSTLIAEARRGLPVPNFQVEPDVQQQEATEGQVSCFDHTLTNLGERDSYSWQLWHEDSAGNLVAASPQSRPVQEGATSPTRQGFAVTTGTGKGWFAWAKMGESTSAMHDMVDVTSDQRPDSVDPVGRRGQAVVRICYTPNDSSGNLQTDLDPAPVFTVRVHSAFDDTIVREVVDSLNVVAERQVLYLHHPRKNNGLNLQHGYKLLMDPYVPAHTDAAINYDPTTGTPSDTNPGLLLQPTVTARYDFQNTTSTARVVATDAAKARVAVATDSTLRGSASPNVHLGFRLLRVRNNNTTTLIGESTTGSLTMSASNPWNWVVHDVPIPTAITLGLNEYLRLEVTCTTKVVENCHLHYDVAPGLLSRLEVTLQ